MTTTDPKLIERIARALERGLAFEVESGVLAGELTHMERMAIAETILPIVAAAINEASQKERAGILTEINRLFDVDSWPSDHMIHGICAIIEAHKESQHGDA